MNWDLEADYKKGVVVPKSALDKEQDRQIGMDVPFASRRMAHPPAGQDCLLHRCCGVGAPLVLSSSVSQCQHCSKR